MKFWRRSVFSSFVKIKLVLRIKIRIDSKFSGEKERT